MNLTHETALNDLIKDLVDLGVVTVEMRLLLRWHDRANLTKGIWRDLQQRFDRELHERNKSPRDARLLASVRNTVVSLICLDGENIEPKQRAWVLVAEFANPTTPITTLE